MKKTLIILLALILIMPMLVQASAMTSKLKAVAGQAGLGSGETNPEIIIGRIVQTVLAILGVVFTLLIAYGGFLWMTAGGDPGKVDKAKGMISNAIIGIVIVFLSYTISIFVIKQLEKVTTGGTGEKDAGGFQTED
ncbi:MAG TPA: pilin [bacterium]|nr:pilin [bacterium]HNS34115.1 pilin [bacterium]HNZ73278.1 pilin [bacterium]HOH67233.1 pilin [bacterium]